MHINNIFFYFIYFSYSLRTVYFLDCLYLGLLGVGTSLFPPIQILQVDLDGFLNASHKLKIKGLTQWHGSSDDEETHNEQSLTEDDAPFLKDPTNREADNNGH